MCTKNHSISASNGGRISVQITEVAENLISSDGLITKFEKWNEPKQQAGRKLQLLVDRVHLSAKIIGTKVKYCKQTASSCLLKHKITCEDRLIINLRNQGIQVRDNIDKMAKNVTNTTNLYKEKNNPMNNKINHWKESTIWYYDMQKQSTNLQDFRK